MTGWGAFPGGTGPRIAVVGGGLTGLVAADRLSGAGLPVTVFEKYPEAGGLVGTFEVGGTLLERFYHHLFTSDTEYVSLARELGLDAEIEWRPSRMGFYSAGRLWDFGTPASLLRFSPLGLVGRVQFALSTLRLRGLANWRSLEAETAEGWMRRNGFGRAFDTIWGPLLRQKFGSRAGEIGLVWLWGKIALRSRSRSSSGLGERLGYMRGSFGRTIGALVDRLRQRGADLRTARPVRLLSRAGGGYSVEYAGGREAFDLVLSTVAVPELLRLAPELPPDICARWRSVSYTHALCPVLELDRPLTPYYWINVGDGSMPFGGLIEHTNYVPPEVYGGRHVVYLSNYVLPDDPRWRMRDEKLWDVYLPGIRRIVPGFDERSVLRRQIFRGEFAQPIVTAGYGERLPEIRAGLPGLYSASMAQIYPEDRGQNYAVRMGRTAAAAILEDLGHAGASA